MASVRRPDGAEIAWRVRGEGPLVVPMRFGGMPPWALREFSDELASDHRVLDYDLRGTGESSRSGPYEIGVDTEDTIAVLEQADGGPAVAVALGDGAHRAVRVATERPDLVSAVIVSGQTPFGRIPAGGFEDGPDALGLSDSVFDGLIQLYESDFKAGLRTVMSTADPSVSDDEIRERVEAAAGYCEAEAMTSRLRSWRADDARETARTLGDRLWIQAYPGNTWFPIELLDVIRQELPEARLSKVEDGPISRPDVAAAAVREITACRS